MNARNTNVLGSSRLCIVDDMPALLARLPMSLPARHYTTSFIIYEVKDLESREAMNLVLGAGLIEVRDPPEDLIDETLRRLPPGLAKRLSRSDASILALALILAGECGDIAVATDDYSLQEAETRLGFKVIRIRYRGARSLRRGRGGRP